MILSDFCLPASHAGHQHNLQRMERVKQHPNQKRATQRISDAAVKGRESTSVYKRHLEYLQEIMHNCKPQSARMGHVGHDRVSQQRSIPRRRRNRTRRRRRRRRRGRFQGASPAQTTANISRRRRLHGWSNDDMNWRVKKADRRNWRRGSEQAKGLGQTSHRGQCSNGLGIRNQDSSWSMTSQSLTAPIACDQQGSKSFRLNQPQRQRLHSASASFSL